LPKNKKSNESLKLAMRPDNKDVKRGLHNRVSSSICSFQLDLNKRLGR
jgi:hypothetical protein